jgi:serine/threonine protein kinase
MRWTATDKAPQAIGNYELIEKIADGGMSSVYKGRHRATGQIVAVKVVRPSMTDNAVLLKRFEREFRAASGLDHPHFVRGLDFGYEGASVYLVMEFVEGGTLGDLIERDGRLPEAEALRIIIQVAQALAEAHGRGIIHRDVKPDNILLTSDGQAKLTDLGLVKSVETIGDLTQPSAGLGTPNFMAPEQFNDARHADARCDIYSLGATLYMAVTGALPFACKGGYLPVLKRKLTNQIQSPRELVPTLSERVDRAIRRAMSVARDQRQASCAEFVKDLAGGRQDTTRPAASLPQAATVQPLAAQFRGKERRRAKRYTSRRRGTCQPIGSEQEWPAKVLNVSASGMGLLLGRRFEPETVLSVRFPEDSRLSPTVLVRVIRVQRQPPRNWLIACRFGLDLPSDEVEMLL